MTEKTAVRPWTAEEDELLLKAVTGKASDNWKDIAAFVPGRTNKACRKRWLHSLCPSIKKTGWTKEEDRKLVELHAFYGNKWSSIARFIPGRTDDACSKRFREALDPNVKKDVWSLQEDEQLLMLQKRIGCKWKEVGLDMQRSSLDCRNRFRLLERRGPSTGLAPYANAIAGSSGLNWPTSPPPVEYYTPSPYTNWQLDMEQSGAHYRAPSVNIPDYPPPTHMRSSYSTLANAVSRTFPESGSTNNTLPLQEPEHGSEQWSDSLAESYSPDRHMPMSAFDPPPEDMFCQPVMFGSFESPTSSPETTPLPPSSLTLSSGESCAPIHGQEESSLSQRSSRQTTRKRKRPPEDNARLSACKPVNARIKAYACGFPKCWPAGQLESTSCFATSGELADHNNQHACDPHEEKPFRCALCGTSKRWKSINGLQYHLQISAIHFEAALKQSTTTNNADSDGKIKCDIPGCDKTYKQHSGLYYHKKHGHNAEPVKQLDDVPPSLRAKLQARSALLPPTSPDIHYDN